MESGNGITSTAARGHSSMALACIYHGSSTRDTTKRLDHRSRARREALASFQGNVGVLVHLVAARDGLCSIEALQSRVVSNRSHKHRSQVDSITREALRALIRAVGHSQEQRMKRVGFRNGRELGIVVQHIVWIAQLV